MTSPYTCTTLLLVRHGQARAENGSYDRRTPLSELGRRQAAHIAQALSAGDAPDAIYASPFPRALETAEPLCRALGREPIVEARLAEFQLSLTLEHALQRPDLQIWHPDHRGVDQGETLGELSARVAALCEELVERHPNARVVVFAHSRIIGAALRWVLGLSPESLWQHEFDLGNGSLTEVGIWPRGRVPGGAPRHAVIRRIGDGGHLGDCASEL
jgi:broad specificity phosphatase PhoE